ncbi:porin, partial [Microvirga aerophila]
VTSFFSNGDLPTDHMGTLRFDDAPEVNLLAYTFSFGNGFSASISLEDGIERRSGIVNLATGLPETYGGQRVPDVVGNFKYTGTWGTAQLSGAVHQIRTNTVAGPNADFDTEYGFAISGTVGVNLPMLGAGDALWFAATYADGAPAYLNGGLAGSVISPFAAFENGGVILADGTVDPVTGNFEKTRAWAIAGGLRHYWTPQVRSNIFGSYLDSDSRLAFNTAGDFREYRLGANVFWQPVSGLDLGVEVIYANVDLRGTTALGFPLRESTGWEGRLRVQRDF